MASPMYVYYLLILFTGITIISAVTVEDGPLFDCGLNEEYNACGSPCIETCDYTPELCVADCKNGCFCKPGFVRQSDQPNSPCINRSTCPINQTVPKCCKNQEYLTCGTACPKTCDDFSYPLPKPAKMCIALCKSGCFCKEGYYRSGRKKCVVPQKCCTGDNEVYTNCGTACPETCGHKSEICTKQCVAGCFCESDEYVRKDNSTNSPCIKRNQCPK